MTRLDLDIVFKQTTSNRIMCKLCRAAVNGENGYIKINLNYFDNSGWHPIQHEKRIVVCNKCFKKWIDKIETAKEDKKTSYNNMVKTKILKNLK